MTYNHNYLTDVILRVDFVKSEETIKKELNIKVLEKCLESFPIKDIKEKEQKHVVVVDNPENPELSTTTIKTEKVFEWHFFGRNREKELTITNNCFIISLKQYVSFVELENEFLSIFSIFCENYPETKINRVGLRYVDQLINIDENPVRESWNSYWSKYIDSKLLQGLSFCNCDKNISRYLNMIELNYGESMLRFQYGIFNKDYPAVNKQYSFLLDTDVYAQGVFEIHDLKLKLSEFHSKAKDIFEEAITDELRKKMEIKTDE